MKRIYALILVLMTSICGAAAADVPELAGREAALYCAENGQVLLDKNMDVPVHPGVHHQADDRAARPRKRP